MRISLSIEGGIASFPGLRKPATIDVDALPASERERLRGLVAAASFYTMAEGSSPPVPDARTFVLEIEDGQARRSLRIAEPVASPQLNALLQAVRAHCSARRMP
jgi:hypothetical protein